MIKIVVYRVGQLPVVEEIEKGLTPMQNIVGGYIEGIPLDGTLILYCNEDGRLHGLPHNRYAIGHDICGDFFVGAVDQKGESVSLTDEEVQQVIADV